MQIIGFNFKKISAVRAESIVRPNINITFTEVEKEKVEVLKEDALKVSFKFVIAYHEEKEENKADKSEVVFEGNLLIKVPENEIKKILNDWKKKKLSDEISAPIFNYILRKCSTKAMLLEEDINLPFHIIVPQVKPGQKE